MIIPEKTLIFQVQPPFKRENISEYSVVTQAKTDLARYLIFIKLEIRLNQITWHKSVVIRLDRFPLITASVSKSHESSDDLVAAKRIYFFIQMPKIKKKKIKKQTK